MSKLRHHVKETMLEFLEHPFIPKKKHYAHLLMTAGFVLILVGCILQVRYSANNDIQLLAMEFNGSSFGKVYTPADIVSVIPYVDSLGQERGTVVVTTENNNKASCGYGINNRCFVYLNLAKEGRDLVEYPIAALSFDAYHFKSIEQKNASTFEITTEIKNGDCTGKAVHTLKLEGFQGSVVSTDVTNTCIDKTGKVSSVKHYTVTAFE
jgi:hypothetical protein